MVERKVQPEQPMPQLQMLTERRPIVITDEDNREVV
jgi:hypothetical protein